MRAGIGVRHLEMNSNVPMFVTNRACVPGGVFSGPLVVSMRPVATEKIDLAIAVTEPFQHAHGSPVHIGDPSALGIANLSQPDFGDAVDVRDGEQPVFWACGVTPQLAIQAARPDLAITHEPGQMFITDLTEANDVRTIS